MIFVPVTIIISKVPFCYLMLAVFKVLINYEAHWQRRLKDILQLKILLTWINMRVNSFLGKYHETSLGESDLKIISCTKIWASSLKNVALRHLTYYHILLFL